MTGEGSELPIATGSERLEISVVTTAGCSNNVTGFDFGISAVRDGLANADHKKVLSMEFMKNDSLARFVETLTLSVL